MSLTVALVPAYNEARFIGSVVLQCKKYVDNVIVVNDCSNDDTAEIAQTAGAIVISHEQNKGKGGALNSGFAKAREIGATALVLLDGDGQHRPSDIPTMLEPIYRGESDIVIGSRYLSTEGKQNIPSYRKIGQAIVTSATNISARVTSTDSWSGYRAFSHIAIQRLSFKEGGWGVDPEIQFQAHALNLRVSEVPIVALYEERAKRNPIPHGVRTLNAIIRMASQYNPLLYLGAIGCILIAFGVMLGLYVTSVVATRQELAVGLTMLSVLLSVIGITILMTGIMLNSIRYMFIEFSSHNAMTEFRKGKVD
jgi:glycosyltransferase involved in cell wall biosynthesis